MLPEPTIIYSHRRTICLQITRQGKLLVRAPKKAPFTYIENLLIQKQNWIEKKLTQIQTRLEEQSTIIVPESQKLMYKTKARLLFQERLDYWSQVMNVRFSQFRLSSAKTRWGSCSSRNSISLNWRLILAPLEILDYVVIHELAHIKEKNHSKQFWNLVEKFDSNWHEHRDWLKKHGHLLFV